MFHRSLGGALISFLREGKTVVDISVLTIEQQIEIASYIKDDNLEDANKCVVPAVPRVSFYTKYIKRILDLLIGVIAFVISLPINLIIGIVTIFDVGFPIIFKQTRIGKNKKEFTIYKFRNMTNATDANGDLLPPSQRVTKWGSFVRKASLDELLNFVSVIKGDMSIIGPRPLINGYADRLHIRHQAIYAVRPGLECPTLHRADHALSWQERLDNYVWYVENCSFWVDVKLCWRIVAVAFDRKATKVRSKAIHGGLLGYDKEGNIIYTRSVPDKYVEQLLNNHGYKSLQEAIDARNITKES